MSEYDKQILRELKKNAGKESEKLKSWVKKYMGTDKIYYSIKSETKKRIVKDWIKNHPNLPFAKYIALLNSLYAGKSHEEFCCGALLLGFMPELRKKIKFGTFEKWLERAEGWGEVDALCQSNFSSEELLGNWLSWSEFLTKLSKHKNIHKRRASLVLLVKSVRSSTDPRLADLAFKNIERLKGEKDILITKAISWLLRGLIKNHRKKVEIYLEKNKGQLPKIAVREARRKLLTGKK